MNPFTGPMAGRENIHKTRKIIEKLDNTEKHKEGNKNHPFNRVCNNEKWETTYLSKKFF